MAFCLLCGCQDSTKYPTKCEESPSQTEAEVLWPSQEELSVLSDGSLAEVDLTHAMMDIFVLGYFKKLRESNYRFQRMIKNITMI